MAARLLITPDQLAEFLAQRRAANSKRPAWKCSSYAHVRCTQPKVWRAGTKSVEVEGLGRGLVSYERIDGTLDVRFHVRRLENYLQQQKGIA